MLNFHRDFGAIPKGLGASLMYFKWIDCVGV